jgi:predicted RecA/RadA family phage recombinase
MMKIAQGDTIPYTPSSAVSAGDVVVQGALIGVATENIAAGQKGSLAVEGIFSFTRQSVILGGIDAGETVYWDPVAQDIRLTPGANGVLLGKATEPSGQNPTNNPVRVKLTH